LSSPLTGFANTSVKADDKVPHTGIPGTRFERTFIAIKPDGVQRGIVGEIVQRFEKKGYKLVGLKVHSLPSVQSQ
jgi:nucleoside-diphosphate kinase